MMNCVEAKRVFAAGVASVRTAKRSARGVGAVGEEEWARATAGQVDELRGDARGVFSDGAFSAMWRRGALRAGGGGGGGRRGRARGKEEEEGSGRLAWHGGGRGAW